LGRPVHFGSSTLRSVHLFLHSLPFCAIPRNPMLSIGLDTPQKVPLPVRASTPIYYMVPWVHPTQLLKRHLDRFCRFWATVCKTVHPVLSDRCLSCPVCDVGVLWPNGWMDQDETCHAGRPRPWPHCVRWGPSSPTPKGAEPPIFGPYLLQPNGWMDQDATWCRGRPRPRRLCVRRGPCSPPRNGAEPPNKKI